MVLLAAVTLAVCKPRGMTRYGLREQREQREQGHGTLGSGDESGTKTPRWVKVFGVIAIVLTLLVAAMLLAGGHGPGAHAPAGT